MDKMTSVFKIQHSTLLSFFLVWDNEIRFTVPRALKTSLQIQYLHARKQTVIYAKKQIKISLEKMLKLMSNNVRLHHGKMKLTFSAQNVFKLSDTECESHRLTAKHSRSRILLDNNRIEW